MITYGVVVVTVVEVLGAYVTTAVAGGKTVLTDLLIDLLITFGS